MSEKNLCQICTKKIQENIKLTKSEIQNKNTRAGVENKNADANFTSYSLIQWAPDKSDFLSALFLKLKGESKKKIWQFFAQEFLKELVQQNRNWFFNSSNAVIIPCPSKLSSADHAEQWAMALSKELGIEYLPALVWKEEQRFLSQKDKSITERWKAEGHVKFTIAAKHQERLALAKEHIFVDDVVTTGATAAQAHWALGKPKNFILISLGKRTRLANT